MNDIGWAIYIWGADNGAWGPAILRGRITEYVSAATIRLDVLAAIGLTRTEFAAPAIDFYTPASLGTLNSGFNDVKNELLHLENYARVGLVVESFVLLTSEKIKIHERACTD